MSEGTEVPAGADAAVAGRVRRALDRAVRDPFTWILVGWTGLALLWVRRFRWSGFFELDEAGYAGMALRLASVDDLGQFGRIISGEGTHGPLQAILAFPPQRLLHPDPRVLLVENVLLAAGTGLLACLTVRRLAGRTAGTVAGTLVLLAPAVIEHGRLALTTTPSLFAAMAVVHLLVRADGLERPGWAGLAGVALGSMTLARSMTVGFAPALGLMAVGWAVSRRTPPAVAARGAVALAVGSVLSAAWWWYLRWADVSHYLLGGGSADTERHRDPGLKLVTHTRELIQHSGMLVVPVALGLGLVLWSRRTTASDGSVHRVRSAVAAAGDVALGLAVALAVVLVVVWPDLPAGPKGRLWDTGLREHHLPWLVLALAGAAIARVRWHAGRRGAAADPVPLEPVAVAPDPDADPLAVWPVWLGVGVGLATLSASTAYGVGFVLPLVPWLVVAGVVTARRALVGRPWRWWWAAATVSAMAMAVTVPGSGVDAELVFCGPDAPRAYCDIDSNADGVGWRIVSDRIADRLVTATFESRGAGLDDPQLALTGRDLTVNANTVQLSMQWRWGFALDVWGFLRGDAPVAVQLAEVRGDAEVVVVVPDRYEELVIGFGSPTPEQVVAAVVAGGFRPCDEIPTPGGDPVLVFASPLLPDAACATGPADS